MKRALAVFLLAVMLLLPADVMAAGKFDPKAPVNNLRVSSTGYNYVKLKWDKSDYAKGYRIYRAKSENGRYRLVKITQKTYFKNTGRITNKRYYYKVRAYGKTGNRTVKGRYSGKVSGVAAIAVPAVKLKPALGGVIAVSWNKIKGAEKYQIYRATGPSGKYKKVKTTKARSWKDTGKPAGTFYYYKVRAYRHSGGKIRYSGFSPAGCEMSSPGRVTGVTAASDDGFVALSWTPVQGASGYEIYRKTSADSDYRVYAETAGSSFSDSNVSEGQTYYYRVRAYRAVDGSRFYGEYSSGKCSAERLVEKAAQWLGTNKDTDAHKAIIDCYNSVKPLPVGYEVKYTDEWCAAFVTAAAIKSDNLEIMPRECGCERMINLYKSHKRSKWEENDSYVPEKGDLIMYRWDAEGSGDCTARAQHVGIVTSAGSKSFTTIEGNTTLRDKNGNVLQKSTVAYKTVPVDYTYTRGFCLPDFDEGTSETYTPPEVTEGAAVMICDADGDAVVIDAPEDMVSDYDRQLEQILSELDSMTSSGEKEKMQYIVDYVREEMHPSKGEDAGFFYGNLIFNICSSAGIDATLENELASDGGINTWNVVILDGKTYYIKADENSEITECILTHTLT